MKFEIECPHCSRRYTVESNAAGKQVRCKACQKTFLIPAVAPEPEPAVPMAELILEPLPSPKPAPLQPASVPPSWQSGPLEPVQQLQPVRRRKYSKPKQGYRPTVLEQTASGLLFASFMGNILQGPPIGPFTWALQAGLLAGGLILWFVAMVRRGSQIGMVVVCGASVVAMGVLVFQLMMLGNRKEPLNAQRENAQEEAEEFRSTFRQQESGNATRPPRGSDRRQTTVALTPQNPVPSRGKDTELVGGTGGGLFRSVSPSGEPVVGLTHRMGSWDGEAAISDLQPMFGSGATSGFLGGGRGAREGYGLGALEVDAATYVSAVRPIYMRIKPDGQLDPADTYQGEWIGTPTGRATKTLRGGQSKVIGICGRRAAVLDAVGLVTERGS